MDIYARFFSSINLIDNLARKTTTKSKKEKVNGKENEEMKCYYCEECGLVYANKKKAEECEEWCREHKSCNIEIIKHSLKMEGGEK